MPRQISRVALRLGDREARGSTSRFFGDFKTPMKKKIDKECNYLLTVITDLKNDLDTNKISKVEGSLKTLVNCILSSSGDEDVFSITPKKKEEREMFVALGGMEQVMRFFCQPFGKADARDLDKRAVSQKSDFWNETFVLLREICYTLPYVPEKYFGNKEITTLFTWLAHESTFENTAALLEEMLKMRMDSFSLDLIPDLYGLI